MKWQLIWPIVLMGLLSYCSVECRRRGGRQRLPIKDEEGSRHVDKRKKASGMNNPIAGYFILGAKNLEEKMCKIFRDVWLKG